MIQRKQFIDLWELSGIQKAQKTVNCLKTEKKSGLGKKEIESQKVVFSHLQFSFAIFLLKQHQLPTQYKILNHFPHAESLQFTQTTQ